MGRNDTDGGSATGNWRRLASAAAGGALVVEGLRRRSLGGAAAATAGGWLLYRGLAGRSRKSGTEDGSEIGRGESDDWTEVTASVTVGVPADELYDAWRDPETLSQIVGSVAKVFAPDEDNPQFVVSGPLGVELTWDTEIVEDRSGEFLRWVSVDDAAISHEGSVSFRPAANDRGTTVTLRIRFDVPGGDLVAPVVRRFGVVPGAVAGTPLRRLILPEGSHCERTRYPSARGEGDLL